MIGLPCWLWVAAWAVLGTAAMLVVGRVLGLNRTRTQRGGSMLLQLHWQKLDDIKTTEFVEQSSGINSTADQHAWMDYLNEKYNRRVPDGWCPLICTEDSEYFVRQASP